MAKEYQRPRRFDDVLREEGTKVQEALRKSQGIETDPKLRHHNGHESVNGYLTLSEEGRFFGGKIVTLNLSQYFGMVSREAFIHKEEYTKALDKILKKLGYDEIKHQPYTLFGALFGF